jgi:iron complex transport system ATP-binding protein
MDAVTGLAEKGYCVVMSTHSPEHPLSVGHKVMLMRAGRAAAYGAPTDVITPEALEEVYGVAMDVVSVEDRYGATRTVCLPVKAIRG